MKIVNWLFGSFFRTIGRTIAILLMGGLLYYIFASNGVGISDLFLDRVDALSLDGTFTGETCPYNSTRRVHLQVYSDLSPTDNIKFSTNINTGNNDYMVFPIQGLFLTVNGINQSQTTITSVIPYIHVYLKTNKNWTSCEFQNNELVCPVPHDAIASELSFSMETGTTYTNSQIDLNIQVYNCASMYKKDNSAIIEQQQETTDAINSQTQQQQQHHQQMMDDNTTVAEDEGSSFFGNFTSEDHGGLNAIITAPLNTIRSLLNSSCTKLTLPLPYVNKNIELPCMNDIYTEHFGLFFSLYQTIILAIISYRCLRSIFFDITGFTNPEDDRIEVMDL